MFIPLLHEMFDTVISTFIYCFAIVAPLLHFLVALLIKDNN